MPTDRALDDEDSADDGAILLPRARRPRRGFDPVAALLVATLGVCVMTAFALYIVGH